MKIVFVVALLAPLLLVEARMVDNIFSARPKSFINNALEMPRRVFKNIFGDPKMQVYVVDPQTGEFVQKIVSASAGNNVAEALSQMGLFDAALNEISNNEIDNNDLEGALEEEHSSGGEHKHFGYDDDEDGPDMWPEHYPTCGGSSQSPVNIVKDETVADDKMPRLVRENYWENPEEMTYMNNGHSLQIEAKWSKGSTPTISGGPLNSTYVFQQLHIHWGKNNEEGSEHTVNGQKMPMELHVVHSNTKYGSLEKAVGHPDGLAVTGYFFEISPDENPMVERLMVQAARNLTGNVNKQINIDPMPINVLALDDPTEWLTYPGSLTTPPCSEVVTWLVSTKPLKISDEQMEVLRSTVKDDENQDFHNFRPVQEMNGRTIKTFAG